MRDVNTLYGQSNAYGTWNGAMMFGVWLALKVMFQSGQMSLFSVSAASVIPMASLTSGLKRS